MRRSRIGLSVLYLAVLIVSVDGSVILVALPSIKRELQFTDTSLVWVVNAYAAMYGGFLLMGGRLSDLLGRRTVFLLGTALFTVASMGCTMATNSLFLIGARSLQGVGGAALVASAFALIMHRYRTTAERSKAMALYAFVMSSGGIAGLLVGGGLTSAFDWRWVFVINIPIGLGIYLSASKTLSEPRDSLASGALDSAGAIAVTASLVLVILAIQGAKDDGWRSAHTLGLMAASAGLFAIFTRIESRAIVPLIPPQILRLRNLVVSCLANVLTSLVGCAALFVSLYLQSVLHCTPFQVALVFLPANVLAAVCSIYLSARLVIRFGVKGPSVVGILMSSLGLLLLARVPVMGSPTNDVIPGLLLIALGVGVACNPMLVAGMSEVEPSETGVASGIIATSTILGGAVGLAIIACISAQQSAVLLSHGSSVAESLTGAYHTVFLICAGVNALAVPLILSLRRLE